MVPAWVTGPAMGLLAAAAVVTATAGPIAPPALAADAAKVGTCLLRNCQAALAACIGDVQCVENLVCLQACSTDPDEVGCQIKCGDQYSDPAIDAFNSCAVSDKKCVPQRVDEGLFPVPAPDAIDNTFDLSSFQGRWYITAGLNPLFDTFDCQEHYFAISDSGKLFGKINWRIARAGGDFVERSTMQNFAQDAERPGVLYNHDNAFLHYQDDWYVISSKPDEYAFIYYIGQNDAWKGYGGATVYTRSSKLPEALVPELRAAAERAGLDWDKFAVTDNTCPPHPARRSVVEELEAPLRSFGKGFTVLEKGLVQELYEVEEEVEEEIKQAERLLERFEMEAEMGPFGQWLMKFIPMGVKEIIMPIR